MDEIKRSLNQLWQGLSGSRKLSLIGSFAVVLAVLIGTTYFASQPKFSLLYAGLAPAEASKIVDYLQSKKIQYQLSDGGTTVLIPATSVYETRLSLAAQGIPRTSDSAGGVGFELFDKPTFGVSDFMQRANYYRALQGELARTIKQFDEIQEARVMIVVPEERLFVRERRESKASVFVQLKAGRVLAPGQVQAVRFLVANGVEGLQPNRVTVVDNSGKALAEDENLASTSSLTNRQQSAVKEAEEHLREKAQSMLDQVLGPGNSVVRITAELNFDAVQETSERFDPKNQVARSETINNETSDSSTQNASGAVGTPSNIENQNATNSGPTTKSVVTRENNANQFEIGRIVENRQYAIGQVKKIGVAVFLNTRKGTGAATATATATPRSDAEKKSLEEIVKAAIGFTQNDTRKDSFQLVETEFNDIFANTQPTGTPVMGQIDKWLPWASQGFLLLIALSLLFYLWKTVKSTTQSDEGARSEFEDLLAQFEPPSEDDLKLRRHATENEKTADDDHLHDEGGRKHKRRGIPGQLTAEEISKLIQDNPSNTSLAIRQWLLKDDNAPE
ncbi:MAG: flagellar basal-body MS-ring/collar protein FliF [Verrucomicrobiota bacterium]